jgi:hypothetical protein
MIALKAALPHSPLFRELRVPFSRAGVAAWLQLER